MKLLSCALSLALFACTSPTNYDVGAKTKTQTQTAACDDVNLVDADGCHIQISHTPTGNCLITCTNAAGNTCEVEFERTDDGCHVVRNTCGDVSNCCPNAVATVHGYLGEHGMMPPHH